MTIGELLNKYNIPESELLLAEILKKPKEFLHLHPEFEIPNKEKTRFTKPYTDFKKGIPIAYILGYKYFYSLKFKVNRKVLIPRPESEWLIENGLKYLTNSVSGPNALKKLRVLDMGTGSGCLITALAVKTKSNNKVKIDFTATDISKPALNLAKKNILTHKAKVKLIHSDLFESVSGKFDLILANLPYVPITDYVKLLPGLRTEPKLALTDGTDNSELIQKFLAQVSKHLNIGGLVLMEIDPSTAKFMDHLVKTKKLSVKSKFFSDHNTLIRFVQLRKL